MEPIHEAPIFWHRNPPSIPLTHTLSILDLVHQLIFISNTIEFLQFLL